MGSLLCYQSVPWNTFEASWKTAEEKAFLARNQDEKLNLDESPMAQFGQTANYLYMPSKNAKARK